MHPDIKAFYETFRNATIHKWGSNYVLVFGLGYHRDSLLIATTYSCALRFSYPIPDNIDLDLDMDNIHFDQDFIIYYHEHAAYTESQMLKLISLKSFL